MKLNKEELTIGAVFGLSFCLKVGFWGLLIAPLTALLWALGGAYGSNKAFRRVGCAVLPSVAVAVLKASWWPLLAIPLAFGAFTIGYGMPDKSDAGSALGRFWMNLLHPIDPQGKWANIATRATVYVLLAIAFIPVWMA